jgi:hypothetical protein
MCRCANFKCADDLGESVIKLNKRTIFTFVNDFRFDIYLHICTFAHLKSAHPYG